MQHLWHSITPGISQFIFLNLGVSVLLSVKTACWAAEVPDVQPLINQAKFTTQGDFWGFLVDDRLSLNTPNSTVTPNHPEPDPELGVLRLRQIDLVTPAPPRGVPQFPHASPGRNSAEADPDFGILRLRPLNTTVSQDARPNPQLDGIPAQQDSLADPDLGTVRVRKLPPPPPSRPVLYLVGDASYFRSSNVFAGIDPIDDDLLSARIGLVAVPALGPDTTLVAAMYGGVIRYGEQSRFDYNELRLYTGIRQQLFAQTYGEIGWGNQRLSGRSTGNQFYSDHALYVTLARRDVLSPQLALDTTYQFRWSAAEPANRSQIRNYLGTSLTYYLQPDLQASLGYQVILSNFTEQTRQDLYNQAMLQLSYAMSSSTRVRLFGGYSFGNSSNPTIDFNSLILGVSFDVNLSLF